MLEVREVSKMYENQRGVRHMDFTMSRGEIVGFLGPNGAGKTTTMRMITGYLNPTHGTILIDGLSMADQPKKARRKIGYLPETPPLYPDMSVGSYLKFIADLRDIPVREHKQRIGEVVDKLGLQGREKQVIRSLSKGYKQRLGLAQAILHKPDLLVLDEPTSGLDPIQIIEIRQLIKELGENHTVLLSTHILPEVNSICNRVLIINQGQIVMDEKPENISGRMNERFEVSLEIRGSREAIQSSLAELPGVERVQVLGDEAQSALDQGSLAEDSDHPSDNTAAQAIDPAQAGQSSDNPAAPPTIRIRVTSKDHTDLREPIFFRMAELGLPILEMKKETLSLEEVFLKLTTEDRTENGVQSSTGAIGTEAAGAAASGRADSQPKDELQKQSTQDSARNNSTPSDNGGDGHA